MRTSLVVVAAALGSLAFASGAGDARAAHARLPAPVTITASARTYRIAADGRIRRVAAAPLPFPRGAVWFPASGAWYELRHRHLVIGQWSRTLWTSRGKFPSRYAVDVVSVDGPTIAFAYGIGAGQRLYVARTDGPERLVAHGEFPLGWTSGGFFTYRFRGRQLRLRADTGALRETVAAEPLEYAYDPSSDSLYFVSHDAVMRARGTVTERVVTFPHLGLVADTLLMVQPLGHGLLELLEGRGLTVLNPDGSVFARTVLTRDRSGVEAPDSPLAVSPDGRAVAFSQPLLLTAATPNPARGAIDLETVYLLRAGARAATPLHREQVQFAPCLSGANVEWRRRWLLWSAGEGNLALIDTGRSGRTIELTPRTRLLPGADAAFDAYWGSGPPL